MSLDGPSAHLIFLEASKMLPGQMIGWMVRRGMWMFGIGPLGPSREYLNFVSSMGAVRRPTV